MAEHEHPIQGLMDTAMSNIKAMVDVDTVVGDAVTAPDGTIIIPVSTVSFGFGAGGSQFEPNKNTPVSETSLFGGGCGGGAKVKPIAFLIVGNGNVRLMPVSQETSSVDRIIDIVPEVLSKINGALSNVAAKAAEKKSRKKEDKEQPAEGESGDVVDVVAP